MMPNLTTSIFKNLVSSDRADREIEGSWERSDESAIRSLELGAMKFREQRTEKGAGWRGFLSFDKRRAKSEELGAYGYSWSSDTWDWLIILSYLNFLQIFKQSYSTWFHNYTTYPVNPRLQWIRMNHLGTGKDVWYKLIANNNSIPPTQSLVRIGCSLSLCSWIVVTDWCPWVPTHSSELLWSESTHSHTNQGIFVGTAFFCATFWLFNFFTRPKWVPYFASGITSIVDRKSVV